MTRQMFSIFQGAVCQNWPFLWKHLQLLVNSAIKVTLGKKSFACQSVRFWCSKDFRPVRILLAVTLCLEMHMGLKRMQAAILVQGHSNISEGFLSCMLQVKHWGPEKKKTKDTIVSFAGERSLYGEIPTSKGIQNPLTIKLCSMAAFAQQQEEGYCNWFR